jgi:hypothetical protein
MHTLLAAPDRTTDQGRRDHSVLLFLYNTGCGRRHPRSRRAIGWVRFGTARRQRRQDATLSALAHDHDVAAGAVVGTVARRARVPQPAASAHHAVRRPRDRHAVRDRGRRRVPVARQEGSQPARHSAHDRDALTARGCGHQHIRAWLGHVSIDTTNVYAEVDLETKAQMLAACGSFTSGKAPTRRWRDDPSLMQFLRSL